MPPEEITIRCPKCGLSYQSWYRPSMNLQLDNFDDDYIKEMSTATCPECRHTVALGVLIVRRDGVWELPAGTDPDNS